MTDIGERIVGVAAGDGDVAAVLLLFKDGEQLGEFGVALAERRFEAATIVGITLRVMCDLTRSVRTTMGEVAGGVGGVDVQDMRSESFGGVARGLAVDDEVGGIQVDSKRFGRQPRDRAADRRL